MFLQLLSVQQDSAGWISDAVRWVFWFLARGVLILLDGMFNIINDIWKFKFFDNDYVNKIYSAAIIVACTWLVLKVIIEIISHYYINQDDNSSPTRVVKGIIFSIAMMFLITPVFNWGYDLSSKLTQYVISSSSSTTTASANFEASMSSMILTAFADDKKMNEKDKTYFIENWYTTDYNDVTGKGLLDSGEYKYSFHLFPVFIVGLVVVVLLFFIGIQVARRIIELALYKTIAPFVCTSLVSNRSRTFEVWCKGVMGTFLVTAVQYLCLGILFNVFGSVVKDTSYAMSVILIVIGSLLFIISSPQLVSALINANTGAMSNMNELHSLAAMGTSMVALARGSSSSSSTSTSENKNESMNNESSSSNGGDSGPNINSNTSSNLGSASSESHNTNSPNNHSSISSESPNQNIEDQGSFDMNNYDSINCNTTSLADRLDTYKNLQDNNFSLNDDVPTFSTKIDWSDNDVSDT